MTTAPLLACALLAAGCRGGLSVTGPGETVVAVAVMSGREQPPPRDVAVRAGSSVTVQLTGLGPPRALVFGPDGAPVETVDVAAREPGKGGPAQRFTPQIVGRYRIAQQDAPAETLARVEATR